jgi:phosphonate transport system substrate-binding protein
MSVLWRSAFRAWLALAMLVLLLDPVAVHAEAPPALAIGFYLPVIRDVPRKDVEISLRFWIEELAQGAKLTYLPVRMYDQLDDMQRDLGSGQINFVVASAMGVVRHFRAEDLADGFSGYKAKDDDMMLVVRRGAGIQSPADLGGKRMSLLQDDELTDVYLPTLLMRAGLRGDLSQLGAVTRLSNTAKQVYSLFFGKADAALVYRNTYETALALNPQIGQRLQVLDAHTFKTRSPYIALFSSRVSPAHRKLMTDWAMTIGDTPRGRQVLDIYHADVFERTRVQDLVPYRQLLKDYGDLQKPGTAGKK